MKPALEAKRDAWIEDYESLVDQGLTNMEIADRLHMTPIAYQRRISRYECRRPTWAERQCLRLIHTWMERNQRFTKFDLPDWLPESEKQLAIRNALADGLIMKLGRKRAVNHGSGTVYVYGPADMRSVS